MAESEISRGSESEKGTASSSASSFEGAEYGAASELGSSPYEIKEASESDLSGSDSPYEIREAGEGDLSEKESPYEIVDAGKESEAAETVKADSGKEKTEAGRTESRKTETEKTGILKKETEAGTTEHKNERAETEEKERPEVKETVHETEEEVKKEAEVRKEDSEKTEVSYMSSYEDRIKQTPAEDSGRWSGKRGESLCAPEGEEARKILEEHGIKGVQYHDGIPDFSPFSESTVKLGYMTDARHSEGLTSGRDNKDTIYAHFRDGETESEHHHADKDSMSDLHMKYYKPGNFEQANILTAEKWSAEKRDGKEWSAQEVEQFRVEHDLTWHECNDMETMQMIPRAVNDDFGHLGGVGELKERQRIIEEATREYEETGGTEDKKGYESSERVSEAVEAKESEALREVGMKEYSQAELEQTEKDNEIQLFRNGAGETISYADAHREIHEQVSSSLDRLKAQGRDITPEQKEKILQDVDRTLLMQQAENQSRAIGNHGITHIYGVYERMKDTPDEVLKLGAEQLKERDKTSGATAEDMRLGMVLEAVYHDQGYLSEQARRGVNFGSDDSLHGIDSAIVFENSQRHLYEGAVDEGVLKEVTQAMAEHNVLSPKNAEKLNETGKSQPAREEMMSRIDVSRNSEMDPNEGLLRSALLLSDKAALDADEKVPDVLRREETASIMAEYYLDEKNGVFSEEEIASASREMRDRMKEAVERDTGLSETEKERMKTSIEKDIGVRSGEFNLPLSSAAISRDAVLFSVKTDEDGRKTIEAQVTLEHRLDDEIYQDAFLSETMSWDEGLEASAKKIRGAMKDYGIIPGADKGKDSGEEGYELIKTGDETFRINTDHVDGLEHVDFTLKRIDSTSKKGTVSEYEANVEKALERKAEDDAQKRIDEKAAESFRTAYESNKAGYDEIMEFCAAAYFHNPEETGEISKQLYETKFMIDEKAKQEKIKELAARCAKMEM